MARPRHCFKRLMHRSTVLRCSYASASKPGGRPPARPLRRRCPIWSAGCRMTARMPRRRRWLRIAREEQARSARTVPGRVRSLPSPRRGTRILAMTASNAGAWPARVRGRRALTFAQPLFHSPSRVLMGPADGGVHRDRPIHVVIRVGGGQDSGEDPFPGAVDSPSDETFVRRLEGAEFSRQGPPGREGAILPRNGFKGAAVVGPSPTSDRIGRHQRLDPVPHRISDH